MNMTEETAPAPAPCAALLLAKRAREVREKVHVDELARIEAAIAPHRAFLRNFVLAELANTANEGFFSCPFNTRKISERYFARGLLAPLTLPVLSKHDAFCLWIDTVEFLTSPEQGFKCDWYHNDVSGKAILRVSFRLA